MYDQILIKNYTIMSRGKKLLCVPTHLRGTKYKSREIKSLLKNIQK